MIVYNTITNDRDLGHGGQTRDLDGDEDDGYDEVIYPADFRKAGHIVDDEMHRILYAHLRCCIVEQANEST